MSFHALDYVLELTEAPNGEDLSPAEKLVLLVLAHCHNGHRRAAWPSVEKIARESLTTERNVRRILRELERKGIIKARRPERQGRGQYTEYFFPEIDTDKGDVGAPLPAPQKGGARDPLSHAKKEVGDVPLRMNKEGAAAPLFVSGKGGPKAVERGTEGGRGETRNKDELGTGTENQNQDLDLHAFGAAMKVWLAIKAELQTRIGEREWALWVRPALLTKLMADKVFLVGLPPNGRLIEAAGKRKALVQEIATAHGLEGIVFTRYPDQYELDKIAQLYPEQIPSFAPALLAKAGAR